MITQDYRLIDKGSFFSSCRFTGFRKSIILDRKILVEQLDLYQNEEISWDQFSNAVQEAHRNHLGQPTVRKVIPGQPKLEDYFYANPQECLSHRGQSNSARHYDIWKPSTFCSHRFEDGLHYLQLPCIAHFLSCFQLTSGWCQRNAFRSRERRLKGRIMYNRIGGSSNLDSRASPWGLMKVWLHKFSYEA